MNVTSTFLVWLAGLFPAVDIPAWFVGLDDQYNALMAPISGVGAWVDFNIMITCVTFALGVWLVCFIIKLLRAVASYIPFFGGAG